MISDELNKIVNKHIADSTTFWVGKPKMTENELQAGADFAKKKGDALEKAISAVGNDFDTMTQQALDNYHNTKPTNVIFG